MRLLMFFLLCLTFCGFGCLSCSEPSPPKENAVLHVHLVSEMLWVEHLKTFQNLLRSDPEAAGIELENVANKLFGKHILSKEWVPLYFRLSRDGTQHLSDIKRLSDLEIRMLTAIDAEKYAKQIQHHKAALTQFKTMPSEVHLHRTQTEEPALTANNDTDRLEVFKELIRTDPEAARAEFVKLGTKRGYNEHPLFEKWVSLVSKLFAAESLPFSDIREFLEVQLQILKDTAPEMEADQIKSLEDSLEKINQAIQKYGDQHTTPISIKELLK